MAGVNPIPDDYPQVTPYLIVQGAAAAIEFYSAVFGATERMRMPGPDGTIGHCELQLGNGLLMLADEFPAMNIYGPKTIGGTPVIVSLYVEEVDAVFERALQQGATSLRSVETQFYGDRSGGFVDPWGHRWYVASHVEDVSEEDMARRMQQMMEG